MYENGGYSYDVLPDSGKRVNPWLFWLLIIGVVGGLALLLLFGATADAAGGCGGG